MREADRVDIYTGHIVKEVVKEGLTEEVKLEAFASGKEKEIFHAELNSTRKDSEYGPFGEWQVGNGQKEESFL